MCPNTSRFPPPEERRRNPFAESKIYSILNSRNENWEVSVNGRPVAEFAA